MEAVDKKWLIVFAPQKRTDIYRLFFSVFLHTEKQQLNTLDELDVVSFPINESFELAEVSHDSVLVDSEEILYGLPLFEL